MSKSPSDWVVLPHGPLVQLADNLWRVEGDLPRMSLKRCMTIVRRADGKLIIYNAMALDEPTQDEVEALGEIAVVLVPSAYHRMDAPRYRARYPEARFLCPPGGRKRIEEVAQCDGDFREFEADEVVSLRVLDGIKGAEGVLKVVSSDGVTLVFNDAFFNVPHAGGFGGLVMRAIGSSGGPKVTRIFRTFVLKDKQAFRANLEELAQTPDLVRLIPAHGHVVDSDAASTLQSVAATV
jgi:hypothetical protein